MTFRIILGAASFLAMSGGAMAQEQELVGLPASDVLGSEDIWDNPTFVGGVISGGPTASSQY